MTLKHFINEVAHALQEHLGEHYIVDATTTIKNNSIELSGVRIRHEEDTIFPTIYLNDSFELYMNNRISLSEIVIQAAESYRQSRKSIETLDPLDSTVFENCRDKIVYRLISQEQNREMLEKIPYIPFMDLAITFHVIVTINPPSLHSLKITNELQESWGISTQKLFQLASDNTPRLMPSRIVNMQDMVGEVLPANCSEFDLTNEKKTDMIIITNTLGVNGAAVILYPGMLASLAKEYNTDFYVIPSSIHEVILVTTDDDSMMAEYRLLVHDVNDQFVDPEEILSDQVYYYQKDLKRIK